MEADHGRAAAADERRHLEDAYHEVRTSLTTIRTRVVLAERELLRADPSAALARDHLDAVDAAVDRLEALSRALRARRDAVTLRRARVEPSAR